MNWCGELISNKPFSIVTTIVLGGGKKGEREKERERGEMEGEKKKRLDDERIGEGKMKGIGIDEDEMSFD